MLGVTVTFLGSIVSYIILTTLMDVGSFESVRVVEANQPLTTTLPEMAHSEDDSEKLSNYNVRNDSATLELPANEQQTPSSQNQVISESARNLVRKLLMTKIRLAGIKGMTSISDGWLEGYINAKYALLRPATVKSETWPTRKS